MPDRPLHRIRAALGWVALTVAARGLAATVVAAGMTSMVSMAPVAVAAVPSAREALVDIPAGELAAALEALARQTGLELIFQPGELAGIRSPGLRGRMTPAKAVAQLIQGSGLIIKVDPAGAILVMPRKAVMRAPPDEHGTGSGGGKHSSEGSAEQLREPGFVRDRPGANPLHSPTAEDQVREILITADKRDEPLPEIGVVDIKDVMPTIPGFALANLERGQSRYSIRGISTNVSLPTVGVYVDDVSVITQTSPFTGAFEPLLFDFERVDIFKGPQSTLYGGNSMGGAIKYVSARPNLSAWSTHIGGGLANTEHGGWSRNLEGVLNMPLVPGILAVRASGHYRHDAGYIDNVAGAQIENSAYSSTSPPLYTPLRQPSLSVRNKEDYNSGRTYVARLSALWEPNASWSVKPAVLHQDYRSANPGELMTNLGDLTASYRFLSQQTHDRAGVYSLDMEKRGSTVNLRSLSAYFKRDVSWHRDYSFLMGNLFPSLYAFDSIAQFPTSTSTYSQELRLSSVPRADGRLSWVGGVYYVNQKESYQPVLPILDGEQSEFATAIAIIQDRRSRLVQGAVFGEGSFRMTDALDLTAGLQLAHLDHESDMTGDGFLNGGFNRSHTEFQERGVNPKLRVDYRIDPRHALYVSAAKGFRPGGAIAGGLNDASPLCVENLQRLGYERTPDSYRSDRLWTYEIGSRNDLGGGARVDGALFYSDWRNIQQAVRLADCGGGFTSNAGRARVQGAELEASVSPSPPLRLGAGLTYIDARIAAAEPGGVARDGDEVLDVPRWTASASGDYLVRLNDRWDLQLHADYQYRGRQRMLFETIQLVRYPDGARLQMPYDAVFQDDYGVLNVHAALVKNSATVGLFINNLLDERPLIARDSTRGVARATTLRPRTVGLQVRLDY